MLVLLIHYSNSKDPLEYFSTNLEAKQQYDKYWMTYMLKFAEVSGLAHLSGSTSAFIHNLKILETRTHINNIIKYYDIKIYSSIKFAMYNCTYVLYRFQAFGEITYYSNLDELKASPHTHHRIWHFSPNERTRIRIIFHNLKIHHSYRTCRQNITVCTSNQSADKNVCAYNRFTLRGDYSMFYYYSTHGQVYFNLFYVISPYFKLDVTFDLMSNNIIHNIYSEPKEENTYQTLYNIQVIKISLHYSLC